MENALIPILVFLIVIDENFIGKGLFKFLPMILTATFAVILKLMVESRKRKITLWNAILSWVAAVGFAYIFYGIINNNIKEDFRPLAIAFVVWTGDKIVVYFVEKFNVDIFLTAGFNKLFEWLGLNKFKKE